MKKSRIATIPCFVDLDKFRPPERRIVRGIRRQWRFAADTRVIVVAGDVVPHKGHSYLFRSLPSLVRQFDDLRVVVVGRFKRGESCTDRLRRFQLQNGLLRRVKWIGRRNNMHEILAAANVVAIPSIVESLGLVALESMAVGTPVVASDTGGLSELIRHEHSGLLVRPANPEAIGNAVAKLLHDPELGERLVRNGRTHVADSFSPAVVTRKIVHQLNRAVRSRRQRKAA